MKATMSLDLKFRTNLRVEHRLTKDEVVKALALHATTYGDDLENVSEKDALSYIRATLREEGADTIAFLVVEELDPVLMAYAEEAIDRIWQQ